MDCSGSVTIVNPVLTVDWSIAGASTSAIAFIFGGALFVWSIGIGIGLLISVVRRFRL